MPSQFFLKLRRILQFPGMFWTTEGVESQPRIHHPLHTGRPRDSAAARHPPGVQLMFSSCGGARPL